MNKLEQLIQELCPHGVEYKKLGEVCKIKNGQDYKKLKQGDIPVYGSGGIMTYVDTSIYDKPSVLIPRKGSLKNIFYAENGFWNVDTIFYTEINSVYYVEKFFYYLIKQIDLEKFNFAGGVPSLTQSVLNKIMLPVPPLEIQKEIVRILDMFTELEKELEKELEARKKQYEFYREQLFYFNENVPFVLLGDISQVTKLAGFEFSSYVKYSDTGNIIALRGLNIKKGRLDLSNVKYIDNSKFEKLSRSKLVVNDILFTYVGTIGEVAIIDYNNKYYLAPNVALIRVSSSKINQKFLLYYFLSSFMKKEILRFLNTSSMKNLTMENVRKFKIPLPPLEEQERIVNILDRFDALCNDLTCGLPAEIEARRKQYAYYRDKLLTFKNIAEEV